MRGGGPRSFVLGVEARDKCDLRTDKVRDKETKESSHWIVPPKRPIKKKARNKPFHNGVNEVV